MSPHKASRLTAGSEAGWEPQCPILWKIHGIFFLQRLLCLSHQHGLLISMLTVSCLLLLKCVNIYSSGKSTLIKLQHLKLSAAIATTWVQWQRSMLSYHIPCLWAGRCPLPSKVPSPEPSCSTWLSAAKEHSSQTGSNGISPHTPKCVFCYGGLLSTAAKNHQGIHKLHS